MCSDEVQQKINEMVRRIVSRFDPDRIILFGSHAQGAGAPDSDVDLLVVTRVSGSVRKLAVEIEVALADVGLSKDIIVVTPDQVEKYRDVVGGIIYPAIRDGRVLYDRAA